ncbi:hypothetical protein BH23BAC1_BH23BAC1_45610 [soil metagenome]
MVEQYKSSILQDNQLAIFKSHLLTEAEMLIRKNILNLLCNGAFTFEQELMQTLSMKVKYQFIIMQEEGLLTIKNKKLQVTETGKAFIRNIAMVLDLKLQEKNQQEQIFSKAI